MKLFIKYKRMYFSYMNVVDLNYAQDTNNLLTIVFMFFGGLKGLKVE